MTEVRHYSRLILERYAPEHNAAQATKQPFYIYNWIIFFPYHNVSGGVCGRNAESQCFKQIWLRITFKNL